MGISDDLEKDGFNSYLKETLAADNATDRGTTIPADSLAQIIQAIIELDPELRHLVGNEIRTGYMDADTYVVYTRLLMNGYHILQRGAMYGVKVRHTVRDILFAAKVIASASTSRDGKLLDTLISSKRDVNLNMPSPQKPGLFNRGSK